ncbi:Hypothetical predicted protein [Mytilus galloprovincialis]|uniref:Uncharacterized protein n=1 Tax=Mytilus galloprovincialis TaxID=29158 RepID=A0A8B6CS44_MYTGA|nr:Hypothetical predicted protein [Mytilus galloprovincialis]
MNRNTLMINLFKQKRILIFFIFIGTFKILLEQIQVTELTKYYIDKKFSPVYQSLSSYRKSTPLLILFTTWASTKDKYLCHNNTIKNWKSLSPFVTPVLFSDEELVRDEAVSKGWRVLPIRKSSIGLPILKYMYMDIQKSFATSSFIVYSNSDILFTDSIVKTLMMVSQSNLSKTNELLLAGRRINVVNVTAIEASSSKGILKASERGELYTGDALDYFITTSGYHWKDAPDLVVGRPGFDNWIVANARLMNFSVIDTTETIIAVHQTTEAGNKEAHQQHNVSYNIELQEKFNERLRYNLGVTNCMKYKTVYSKNGSVKLIKKSVNPSCFPILLTDSMIEMAKKINRLRKEQKEKNRNKTQTVK